MKKFTWSGVAVALLAGLCVPAFAQEKDAFDKALEEAVRDKNAHIQQMREHDKQEIPLWDGKEDCSARQALDYVSDFGGSDDMFSVKYELKAAEFVPAHHDYAAHWTYVYAQQYYGLYEGTDSEDLLDSMTGKDLSFLPKVVTLHVYNNADFTADAQRQLAALQAEEQGTAYRIIRAGKKTAVLSAPVMREGRKNFLEDFDGRFFPRERACGNESYLNEALPSVL